MSRVNLEEVVKNEPVTEQKLDDEFQQTVERFLENKAEYDSYKKLVEEDNAIIKETMRERGLDKVDCGNKTIKYTVAKKQTFNQDGLLAVLKKHGVPAVKTVEVVDMEDFENYLYHNTNAELVQDVNLCKIETEVVSLRVSKRKD